jgi:hypothetical protein
LLRHGGSVRTTDSSPRAMRLRTMDDNQDHDLDPHELHLLTERERRRPPEP